MPPPSVRSGGGGGALCAARVWRCCAGAAVSVPVPAVQVCRCGVSVIVKPLPGTPPPFFPVVRV